MRKSILSLYLLAMTCSVCLAQDVLSSIPISDPLYAQYRAKAFAQIDPTLDQCAKFVNRMIAVRFGRLVFGNAWTMQVHPDNQHVLSLHWRVDDREVNKDFSLKDYRDRTKHFLQLYKNLDQERDPVGVLGFMYVYSFHKEKIKEASPFLPQTHVAFLAGRKDFTFTNHAQKSQTLHEILMDQYGVIHDFEYDFLAEKLPLKKVLAPGQSVSYQDYLIEDQFKGLRAVSLLEVFLGKHRNNRITPLLRPVSYSQMVPEITKSNTSQLNN